MHWTHIQVLNAFGLYQDYKDVVVSLNSATKWYKNCTSMELLSHITLVNKNVVP